MNIKQFCPLEARAINQLFQANRIRARVDKDQSLYEDATAGFVRYGLQLDDGQVFRPIEALQRELSVTVTQFRNGQGVRGSWQVIPLVDGGYALEVPHPDPKTLHWSWRKLTQTKPNAMLLGQSYRREGTTDERISFAESGTCHALVVGITGAGKSVLLQNMFLSLVANTSPADLKVVLIDLKNEDMIPFFRLPHVLTFAGTRAAAVDAIRYVAAEKDRRIENGKKPYRLVLWIDELAQLAIDRETVGLLGDLASIGRGKEINLVAATQHPTEKGGLGSLLKANFPVRLVGMVAPGQSYVATGRAKTYADLLPGNGAFLRCQGPAVQRFQSFMIEPNDVQSMAKRIGEQWAGHREPTEAPAILQTPVDRHANRLPTDLARIVAAKPDQRQFISAYEEIDDPIYVAPPNPLDAVIEEYWIAPGKMRRGFTVAAVTALNKGVTPGGTTFQRLKRQVDQYLLTYLSRRDAVQVEVKALLEADLHR